MGTQKQQHWGIDPSDDSRDAVHVGVESAFDDDAPCQIADAGDSILAGQCRECGTDVFKVAPDQKSASCEECGTSYTFTLFDEDDLVWD